MRQIPLSPIPNQSLSMTIDLVRFVLRLKTTRATLVADVEINGRQVVTGTRVLAGEMILPYRYQETGNFIMTTVADALPAWPDLGGTTQLFYLTPAEMEALRG